MSTASGIAAMMAVSGSRFHAAAERIKNEILRNLLDNAEFAAKPMIFVDSNPRGAGKSQHVDFDAYDAWTSHWKGEPLPEVKLADALEQARRAPILTVALANKLMRDAHKRGDALAFNAAREALRSL